VGAVVVWDGCEGRAVKAGLCTSGLCLTSRGATCCASITNRSPTDLQQHAAFLLFAFTPCALCWSMCDASVQQAGQQGQPIVVRMCAVRCHAHSRRRESLHAGCCFEARHALLKCKLSTAAYPATLHAGEPMHVSASKKAFHPPAPVLLASQQRAEPGARARAGAAHGQRREAARVQAAVMRGGGSGVAPARPPGCAWAAAGGAQG